MTPNYIGSAHKLHAPDRMIVVTFETPGDLTIQKRKFDSKTQDWIDDGTAEGKELKPGEELKFTCQVDKGKTGMLARGPIKWPAIYRSPMTELLGADPFPFGKTEMNLPDGYDGSVLPPKTIDFVVKAEVADVLRVISREPGGSANPQSELSIRLSDNQKDSPMYFVALWLTTGNTGGFKFDGWSKGDKKYS